MSREKKDSALQAIIDDINKLFGDMNVSKSKAKSRLEHIIEHCETLIESLDFGDEEAE